MRTTKIQLIGIGFALISIVLSVIFLRTEKMFPLVIGISIIIGVLPFFLSIFAETEAEKEKDERFLEFSRNLVESVKTGTPISRSIINIRDKDYSVLNPYIKKLVNQISLGIPVKDALMTFARDANSKTILRSVELIREAEQAGGNIESILDSVSKSVAEIETLKKERRAAIYNLVVQGYIIFIIFIIIMLVMQFKIVPMTSEITAAGSLGIEGKAGAGISPDQIAIIFISLLLAQGFFTGLVIGKLAEGSLKAGIKHSFLLMVIAYIVSASARAFISV